MRAKALSDSATVNAGVSSIQSVSEAHFAHRLRSTMNAPKGSSPQSFWSDLQIPLVGSRRKRHQWRPKVMRPWSMLDRYAEWHAASLSKDDSRFLYVTTWAGLGNRILAVLSAFVLAILTDRVLLLDEAVWNGEDLFAPPIDWSPVRWPAFVKLRASRDTADWHTIDTDQHPFTETLSLLACANLTEAFPQRVLHLHSIGQYLVTLLLLRPLYPATELRERLGARPARQLMRFLLPPATSASQLLSAQPSLRLARPLLCVQLRMHNDWVRRGTPRLVDSATMCATHLLAETATATAHGATAPSLERAVPGHAALAPTTLSRDGAARAPWSPTRQSASGVARRGRSGVNDAVGNGSSVHIAADNSTARDALSATLSDLLGASVSYAQSMAESARQEKLADAWQELLLLSRCDALLTTGGSTFGYVARLLARAPLHRQRYLTKWADTERPFEVGVDCPVLRTAEPCLMHAWREDWRVQGLSCIVEQLRQARAPEMDHLLNPVGERSQCF